MDSLAVLRAIEASLKTGTGRVSDGLGISQFSVNRYIHDLGKSIRNRESGFRLPEYCKTFDFPYYPEPNIRRQINEIKVRLVWFGLV